jgi:hypothetical protein
MHVNPKVECKLDLLWKNKGQGMRGSLQSDYLVPMVSPSALNGQTSSVNYKDTVMQYLRVHWMITHREFRFPASVYGTLKCYVPYVLIILMYNVSSYSLQI